ncbi:GNAT family N-acetyltransferase [Oculatella sp. FACHB-28]|uniref:GNAT family N-acetyltransferase n=1 Tax=Oculatella sp. FACHB-28 TaxID=2692845 RepID=UPI001682BE4E|nr:GNAT family N-acetyltransferase [Oculatella sp. FACHB-28]MBD2058653.1 GNAT family N-acetyltransferase [Oculatella sp. FACHB-28]
MEVFQARFEHLDEVSKLFDQYRVFYQSSSNLEAAKEFLQERLHKKDSTIFVVQDDGHIVGFTQLYPSFSSVSMKRIWILNDLFVSPAWRNKGVAKLLLRAAEDFARKTEAVRITLATQTSNTAAQALYESLGYCKDEAFYHYSLRLVAA